MSDFHDAQLLIAHPGHELLLYGWIHRAKPVLHVLTDGSGPSSAPRLEDVLHLDLDDATFAAKMETACRFAPLLPDVQELLTRHGPEAYRREVFRRVIDWTDLGTGVPEYERFGEKRVAAGRYGRVIRKKEHIVPLRDALRAFAGKRLCVS